MTWRPDDFDDLAADLRRRVGAEFVEEAAEVERLADLQRRRHANLAEAARNAMHRGDRVTVVCADHKWTGHLTAVGNDYARLDTGELVVEAYLPSVGLELEPSRVGGRSGQPPSVTWRARLVELEMNKEEAELYAPLLRISVSGRVLVVATDHVEVEVEGGKVVLPLASVAVLIRSHPR